MNKSEKTKESVLFLLDAINCEDYESALECLDYNFKFQEFLLSYSGSELYLERMRKLKTKFKITRIFADEQNVCVLSNMKNQFADLRIGCGLYQLKAGKIISLHQFSDPITHFKLFENGSYNDYL